MDTYFLQTYPVKKYPILGACGLDCGLCIRYHTEGKSRCPGCCGPGFFEKHPSCGFISCAVKKRRLETCAVCPDIQECEKIFQLREASLHHDSFISYKHITTNFSFIQRHGLHEFICQAIEKQLVLLRLLQNFDDGRTKLFYCLVCQLIPVQDINRAVTEASSLIPPTAEKRDKARIMRTSLQRLADSLNIELTLRK